jgi:hypothetical protein
VALYTLACHYAQLAWEAVDAENGGVSLGVLQLEG